MVCWRERSEHALHGRSIGGGPDRREVGLESTGRIRASSFNFDGFAPEIGWTSQPASFSVLDLNHVWLQRLAGCFVGGERRWRETKRFYVPEVCISLANSVEDVLTYPCGIENAMVASHSRQCTTSISICCCPCSRSLV